ncbi:hypothetical protein E4U55_003804 [Claviceps digitariae]|nr:hypothetical protein E4U55_003804 [Claviceps digitariae]
MTSLATLPPEMLSMIATELELDDLLRCRRVSRSWHATWTRGAVIVTICHSFFPGLLEKADVDRDPRCVAELLQSCIARYLWHKRAASSEVRLIPWRERASTSTSSSLKLSPNCLRWQYQFQTWIPSLSVFYEGGWLAWQFDSECVYMHNLRTGQRRMKSFPHNWIDAGGLRLRCMSRSVMLFSNPAPRSRSWKNMLCLTTRRGRKIWYFRSNCWKYIRSSHYNRCYVEGEQVALISHRGNIKTFSRKTEITIDRSHSHNTIPEGYESSSFSPGLILHPNTPNITYVAQIFRSKIIESATDLHPPSEQPTYLMSVVRYDGVTPTKKWLETIQHESLCDEARVSRKFRSTRVLLCRKMSAHGLYSIGIVHRMAGDRVHEFEFATTGFNIYKESFIQRPFEYAKYYHAQNCHHLNPTTAPSASSHGHCLTTWSKAHAMIPRYCVIADSNHDETIWYPWDVSRTCHTWGDDDFHVTMSKDGFQASSFARDAQRPVGNKLASEKLLPTDPVDPNSIRPPVS